jgi:hypothetical protein
VAAAKSLFRANPFRDVADHAHQVRLTIQHERRADDLDGKDASVAAPVYRFAVKFGSRTRDTLKLPEGRASVRVHRAGRVDAHDLVVCVTVHRTRSRVRVNDCPVERVNDLSVPR